MIIICEAIVGFFGRCLFFVDLDTVSSLLEDRDQHGLFRFRRLDVEPDTGSLWPRR